MKNSLNAVVHVFNLLVLGMGSEAAAQSGSNATPDHPWKSSFWCGYAMSPYGDWNRDGRADFLVSTPRDYDIDPLKSYGSVGVVSGADGSVLLLIRGQRMFGLNVDRADDINGDGRPEIIIDNSVFESQSGSTLFVISEKDWIVRSVRRGFDSDHDGITDLVVVLGQAVVADGIAKSRLQIRSGRDGNLIQEVSDTQTSKWNYGICVPCPLDSGTRDLLVVPTMDSPPSGELNLELICPTSGQVVAVRKFLAGERPCIAAAPVVDNSNGVVRIAIGVFDSSQKVLTSEAPSQERRGIALLIDPKTLETVLDLTDVNAAFRFGKAVDSGSDIDADGVSDVLITEYADSFETDSHRQLLVYSGKSGALIRRHPHESFLGSEAGRSAAWVGDVNADGVSDYAVSSSNQDPTSYLDDFALVFSGADGKLLLRVP